MNTLRCITVFIVINLLYGCSATVVRLPELSYSEVNSVSYIWHRGNGPIRLFEFIDFGYIQKINNVSLEGLVFDVIEIPSGEYTVLIDGFEENIFSRDLGIASRRIQKSLTLKAEEDRIYVPFHDDKCHAAWVWIEDWGSATERGFKDVEPTSDLTKPVVAGEAPPKKCE